MTKHQRTLVLISTFIILVMMVVVPLSTATLGTGTGVVVSLLIYWFALCWPAAIWAQGPNGVRSSLKFVIGRNFWIPVVVAALPTLMLLTIGDLIGPALTPKWILIGLLFAAINGLTEEVFWRGSFYSAAPNLLWFQSLGLLLFTLWHVPAAFAQGLIQPEGHLALVGGAFGLGLVWMAFVYLTGKVGWAAMSHVIVNSVGFLAVIALNFA